MRTIRRLGHTLISYRDIQATPEGDAFTQWALCKTMALIDGEPWVYIHDWERFQRYRERIKREDE